MSTKPDPSVIDMTRPPEVEMSDEQKIAEINKLLEKGREGPGVDGEEVFARLKAKYQAMIKD